MTSESQQNKMMNLIEMLENVADCVVRIDNTIKEELWGIKQRVPHYYLVQLEDKFFKIEGKRMREISFKEFKKRKEEFEKSIEDLIAF